MIEMGITPHMLFLDESNWFTYIEKGEELPGKGKIKQFRYDKNLISVGLAVSEDNVPFMHETYEGNMHDSNIFPRLLDTLTFCQLSFCLPVLRKALDLRFQYLSLAL